ncbi:methyltransferase domain-containing protein [Niabella ginsengisoli]|uniref:Methyltransferase domain-containing protein n=1 Tax=Niabella ginsengisoli TaxID=522298 RepID=A0ABS9SJF8_9BACT|nr:methyltransferase domain-containing protein [Niabella ginsengisoli]MCH5598508.1 methyltransferase domain-containing protein [Niabella ginsengisoli]
MLVWLLGPDLLWKPFIYAMPDFSTRSYDKELLDDPAVPFEHIRQNMQELNNINTLLGGHSITLKGFKKLLGKEKQISVCEIGCGGGDNLFVIDNWCRKNGVTAHLSGIDINPNCIEFATNKYGHLNIEFICSDYKTYSFESKPDILFNSLFCHHFNNNELMKMLQWMKKNSSNGFFINDLHRHPIAYYSIKWLTKLFSKSYLVKNDAPLSVLRGLKKNEWKYIVDASDVNDVNISWEWAFRHLVVYKK